MNTTNLSRTSVAKPAPPTHAQIAALAHEIWRERGAPEGSDIDIWLEAERQLRGQPASHSIIRNHIPADPANPDPDHDPALNPSIDQEIQRFGSPPSSRGPTAFDV